MDELFGENLRRFIRSANLFDDFGSQLPEMVDRFLYSDKDFDEPSIRQAGSVVQDEDMFNPTRRMRELYQPDTVMSDRYMRALDEMPTRNKPGLLRKIAAGLASFGPSEGVERALYSPYHRDLQDWSTKIRPLQEGANLERQNNANLRMIANSILSQEMADRRLGRMVDRDKVLKEQGEARIAQGDERLSQGDRRLRQADERLKIARAVAKGGTYDVDDSGQAFFAFKDGSKVLIDADFLTAEEKAELEAQKAERVTKAREGAKRDRIVERVIEDPNNPGKFVRSRINLDTGDVEILKVKPETEPNKPSAAPLKSELEQTRGITRKAMEVKNSNASWSKYIKFDKSGRFTGITTPGLLFGPNQEEYDKIYTAIYGESAPTKANAPKGKPAGAPSPGRVRVIGPSGQTGTVSEEEFRTGLPPGWRRAP